MRSLLILFVYIAVEARISDLDYYYHHVYEEEIEFSCKYQNDGIYSSGQCKNHYYICDHQRKITVHCPYGLIYNGKHCNYPEETPECPAYKSDLDLYFSRNRSVRNSICKRKADGLCHLACENEYYSCKNGSVTWHKCPKGYVHRGDACVERDMNFRCSLGIQVNSSYCIPDAPKKNGKMDFTCLYKQNGPYSAGPCRNHFNICLNHKQFTSRCPKDMVFWKDRCHFTRDVEQCPEYKTDLDLYLSKNQTERDSICEIRGDGHYQFPCENEHYLCNDGRTTWFKCAHGEVRSSIFSCKKRKTHEGCFEYEEEKLLGKTSEFPN